MEIGKLLIRENISYFIREEGIFITSRVKQKIVKANEASEYILFYLESSSAIYSIWVNIHISSYSISSIFRSALEQVEIKLYFENNKLHYYD